MYTIGIPAFNDEKVIEATLGAVRAQLSSSAEMLVCANGCTDRTVEIARDFGARVIESEASENGSGNVIYFTLSTSWDA